MTRIVAGRLGGRELRVPKRGTRPTADRVREALFSRLEHLGSVQDARVLDLFAGSGALGLEAISRGAASATLVECATPAVRVLHENVRTLGVSAVTQVVAEDVWDFLGDASVRRPGFGLVLADPPYGYPDAELAAVLAVLAVPGVLTPGAVVAVERSRRSAAPRWPVGWADLGGKTYGDTAVFLAELP